MQLVRTKCRKMVSLGLVQHVTLPKLDYRLRTCNTVLQSCMFVYYFPNICYLEISHSVSSDIVGLLGPPCS